MSIEDELDAPPARPCYYCADAAAGETPPRGTGSAWPRKSAGMIRIVFKIVDERAWAEACRAGAYLGSPADRRDGFIHLSLGRQVRGTVEQHFSGATGLMLVAFDAEGLGEALKWERSRGGELFPHLYGPLPTAAVLWTKSLAAGEDGAPALPKDLDGC